MNNPAGRKAAGFRFPGTMVCLCALAAFAPPAHAYLDPSTGSMIVTAIVGLIASIGLAVRTYWYRLKSFFKGGRKRKEMSGSSASEVASSARDSSD